MKRTPTTPNTGVDKRPDRVGQDRPSGTAEQGISEKVVAESSKSGATGAIGLGQARGLKIVFTERKGGYDPEKLFMALRMLISEKDFIDYYRKQKPVRIDGTVRLDPDQKATLKISKSDNCQEASKFDASWVETYEESRNLRSRFDRQAGRAKDHRISAG